MRLYGIYSFTAVKYWKPEVSYLNYSLFTLRSSLLFPSCIPAGDLL